MGKNMYINSYVLEKLKECIEEKNVDTKKTCIKNKLNCTYIEDNLNSDNIKINDFLIICNILDISLYDIFYQDNAIVEEINKQVDMLINIMTQEETISLRNELILYINNFIKIKKKTTSNVRADIENSMEIIMKNTKKQTKLCILTIIKQDIEDKIKRGEY